MTVSSEKASNMEFSVRSEVHNLGQKSDMKPVIRVGCCLYGPFALRVYTDTAIKNVLQFPEKKK